MAYYDRGYGAGPRGMGGGYGGGMGGFGGRYGGGFAGGYGPEYDQGFGGGYPGGYPPMGGPGFGYGGGFGYGSLSMPSPYAPPRSSNYVPRFKPTGSYDYYGTTVPIYVPRVPPRGRAFPRHMPMIAHQRMSAMTPAPLYSAASARVAAYEDEMLEPVTPPRPSYKYANSFMEDTVNTTMQDIEDDMRNLRTSATSVLNKYTPTSLGHLDPSTKKTERKSRFAHGFNKKDDSDKEVSADDYKPSYYKLSSASTKESPVLMPIYVARHSIYNKSLTKDPEIERKDRGEKSYRDSTIGNSAQSRRPASSYDGYKISDSITFLSHYIRQAKRPTSTGPAFSTRESRLARRASARDRAADRKDPDRVKGRVAEKLAAQEAEKAKEREELERWKMAAKAEVKWKHVDEADDNDWLKDIPTVEGDAPAAEASEELGEPQPEPELEAEPVEEVKEVKKKKKKKAVKEPTPEPELAADDAEAAPAEEAPAPEEAPEAAAAAEEAAAPVEEQNSGDEERNQSQEEEVVEAVTVANEQQQPEPEEVVQELDVQQEDQQVEAEIEPAAEQLIQEEQSEEQPEVSTTEPAQVEAEVEVEQPVEVELPVEQAIEQDTQPEIEEQTQQEQVVEQVEEPAPAEQIEEVEEIAPEEQQQVEDPQPVSTSEELKELSLSENDEEAVRTKESAPEVDVTDEALAEPNALEESQTVAPAEGESVEQSEEEE